MGIGIDADRPTVNGPSIGVKIDLRDAATLVRPDGSKMYANIRRRSVTVRSSA